MYTPGSVAVVGPNLHIAQPMDHIKVSKDSIVCVPKELWGMFLIEMRIIFGAVH